MGGMLTAANAALNSTFLVYNQQMPAIFVDGDAMPPVVELKRLDGAIFKVNFSSKLLHLKQ